jgi:hypothetical protein
MAIREQETDDLIAFLNSLLDIDRPAIQALVAARVPCGADMGAHPTVQVGRLNEANEVGILGLLNGFCGVFDTGPRAGWGPILAVFDGECLLRFRRADEKAIDA